MKHIDPERSTSAAVNRRGFVTLAAAAGLGAASVTPARAKRAQQLGKVHAPLVAENDPHIVVERVVLKRPDGDVSAYAARPKKTTARTRGVVVVMHIWGVDTSIRDVVRRYAKAGYAAIAPDLFSRLNAPTGDGKTDFTIFRPYAAQLQPAQSDADIRAAALWLRSAHPQGKIAVTGFCMGGAIALRQAIASADLFVADAPFYGTPEGLDPAKVAVPVAGSYGERDTSIPTADVFAFANALHVPHDIKEYPTAGHAFFDDQRTSYDSVAAPDAWRRTLTFFETYLR
ncbi:MAG: dienelactone hydrolase family protein [Candidatus Eremiobacteraeota bacterium]|nr:dienelactone hydrolase family protein [Candidatus Eremiobacteraeota bacterium]